MLQRPNHQALPEIGMLHDMVDGFPPMTAVGFEMTRGDLRMHSTPLPFDLRSTTAGLFGFVAPKSWNAVGLHLEGTAVSVDDRGPNRVAQSAVYSILVTRQGELSVRLSLAGEPVGEPALRVADHLDAAGGTAVDTLYRILGLPSPGDSPSIAELVLALWYDSLLDAVTTNPAIRWDQAAALHCGYVAPTVVGPSVENVVEVTMACATKTSWKRLRLSSVRSRLTSWGLTPSEIRWMDDTMYARWMMSWIPEHASFQARFDGLGDPEISSRVAEVSSEVSQRLAALREHATKRRTA